MTGNRFRIRVVVAGIVAALVCVPLTRIGFTQSSRKPGGGSDKSGSVNFSQIVATAGPDGVLIEWRTAYELNNVGFNVYRIQNGQPTQINKFILPGSILSAGQGQPLDGGRAYSWFDNSGTADCEYYVEDLDLSGKRTSHQPVAPVLSNTLQPIGPAQTGSGPENSGRHERSGSIDAPTLPTPNAPIDDQWALVASQPSLKISVRAEGWYHITQPQLAAALFNVSADAHNLRMFVGGRELPIRVSRTSGPLSSTDYVEFYGNGLDKPTSNTQIYYLVNGAQAGLRIAPVGESKPDGPTPIFETDPPTPIVMTSASSSANARMGPVATKRARRKVARRQHNHAQSAAVAAVPSFINTVQLKERGLYYSALQNGDTENFFGQVIVGAGSVPQILGLNNVETTSSGSVLLRVALQGASFDYHQTNIVLNGHAVGLISYFDQENSVKTFSAPVAWLNEGNNTVTLSGIAGSTGLVLVDFVQLSYPRSFRAQNNSLRFSMPYAQTARIEGFTSANVRVLDISDTSAVKEVLPVIQPSGSGFAVTVLGLGPKTKGLRTLMVVPAGGASVDQSTLNLNVPSTLNLSGNAGDLLIIAHKDFIPSLAPLVAQRAANFTVKVVDIEDVFDEFSYGLHTPQAITDFVAHARDPGAGVGWTTKPRYLILVGDATYDPRNYEGWGQLDFVPTRMIDDDFEETCSDDVLVDFNADGIADIPVGRIAVRTAAQADATIAKIVNFVPPAGPTSAMLVADRNDDGYPFSFEAASDDVATLLPGNVTVKKVYRRVETQVLTGAISADINSAVVTGTGTQFLTELAVGSEVRKINDSGVRLGLVASIASNTSVTLQVNSAATYSGGYGKQSDPVARQDVIGNFNQGVSVVNYSGHGNVNVWRGSLFGSDDAPTLTNANKFPLVIVNDCLNGYFIATNPAGDGIAEALMKTPNGGAVLVFASSGKTIPDGQHLMAQSLYFLLYCDPLQPNCTQPIRIGDAVIQAKAATSDVDVRRTWILFGDPTLKIR